MGSSVPTYTRSTSRTSVQMRRNEHGQETDHGVIIQHSNGTTEYGEIPAGTPLGLITASGLYRPCGKTRVKTAGAGLTTVEVNEGNNFYIADVVQIIDGGTGALIGTKTLTNVVKTGATHSITFAGALAVNVGDIVLLDSATPAMAGAETAVCLLTSTVNGWNKDLGPLGGYANMAAEGAWHGNFYNTFLRGGNALIKADLPAARFD